MRTWRKKVGKLVRAHARKLSLMYPSAYQPLTAKEEHQLVRAVWSEIAHKLQSVPMFVISHSSERPDHLRHVWSMKLMAGFVTR